jgi:hypothetical protein
MKIPAGIYSQGNIAPLGLCDVIKVPFSTKIPPLQGSLSHCTNCFSFRQKPYDIRQNNIHARFEAVMLAWY